MLRGMLSSIPAAEVFVYTGPGGERVPDDVVRITMGIRLSVRARTTCLEFVGLQGLVLENEEEFRNPVLDEVVMLRE
jgi:hypothetical protein